MTVVSYDGPRRHMTVVSYDGPWCHMTVVSRVVWRLEASYDGGVAGSNLLGLHARNGNN